METLMLIWILTKGLLGMPRTMPMTKIMVSFASVLFKIEHLIINEHIDVNEIINIIFIYLICCTQAVTFLNPHLILTDNTYVTPTLNFLTNP